MQFDWNRYRNSKPDDLNITDLQPWESPIGDVGIDVVFSNVDSDTLHTQVDAAIEQFEAKLLEEE